MPEISIILPSLRPELVLQRIKEFYKTNRDSDYEIIVVSPFKVRGDRVVHIYERELAGTIHAHNVAYENSSGRYIVPWADDTSPTTGCLSNMLRFVKSRKEPFIGAFRIKDRRGGELSHWAVYGKLYAGFACFSKKTVELAGGYYDPVYKGYWADPDMCLRNWERGGKVEVYPNAWVVTENLVDGVVTNNLSKYFDKDAETFFNRWHGRLGKGMERTFEAVNKPIGDGQAAPNPPLPAFLSNLSNRMLGFCARFVPEKIKVVIRLVLSKVRHGTN